jgi:hypothetical protein
MAAVFIGRFNVAVKQQPTFDKISDSHDRHISDLNPPNEHPAARINPRSQRWVSTGLNLRPVSDQAGGKVAARAEGLCELLTPTGSQVGQNAAMHKRLSTMC